MECVPNFSEGRDLEKIEKIVDKFRAKAGVKLLDYSNDEDHNRLVVTVVGEPEALKDALLEAIGQAVELIDLTKHSGQHPRMGAVDVVPFIPIRGCTMDEAIAAPSGSSGILCNVTVVDDSHEITGNGVYYLGLTNSSYVLYTDEEQKDVTVCVIGTNAYSRPGSTVTPGVVSMSSGIAGVTLKTTSISADSTAIKLDFAKGTACHKKG